MVDWNRWWAARRAGAQEGQVLAIDPEAQAEGQVAVKAERQRAEAIEVELEDLNRHRHDVVFDFGKGWMIAIMDTDERFHMWIDTIDLEGGAVAVNGVMRPVALAVTIVGYEVYGEDGQVIVRRPVNPPFQFTPSDVQGDVQNMLVRWTIKDVGQAKLAQKGRAG